MAEPTSAGWYADPEDASQERYWDGSAWLGSGPPATSEAPFSASGRRRQILESVPHYLNELSAVRRPRELRSWLQFKLPYLMPVPSFPPRVNLEITNRCNLSCVYCHRQTMNREVGEMEFGLLEKLVAEVSAHPDSLVKVVGLGEPSLHPRCGDLMCLLRDSKVDSILYTNGSLLNRFEHEDILEWEIPHLVVSVDGIDASTLEQQRLGGDHRRLKESLEAFHALRARSRKTKPLIEVRHVITPTETRAQLADFRRYWLNMADTVMFNHIIPSGPIEAEHATLRRCRDIRREMYVQWDGRVAVCGYQCLVHDPEWIADLHDCTVRSAWLHDTLTARRHSHARGGSAVPAFCRVCSQTN